MADIAYLIGHRDASKFSADEKGQVKIDFSEIEKTLRDDGFDLGDLSIIHVLIDAKVPVNNFENFLRYQKVAPYGTEVLANYPDALRLGDPSARRYQTIIRFDKGLQGNVLGYSPSYPSFRKKYLPSMVYAYVKGDLLTGEKSKYAPPYFIVSEPELCREVKRTFQDLGVKVKRIRGGK